MREHTLYNPYPHQLAMHQSKAKRKYAMFPARSGKDVWMVNDALLDTIAKRDMWMARSGRDYRPRWNCWFVAETYQLLEQLWRDMLAYCPRELLEPGQALTFNKGGDLEIKIVGDGRFKFRSARNEQFLVAEGLDQLNVTEGGELPTTAWELLQSRTSDASRMANCTVRCNGTPRGQIDPLDPTKEQWLWGELCNARKSKQFDIAEGFYWYEDKANYNNLEHPILSLTVEGKKELDFQRSNPNLSPRKFREDYLGECMPIVLGDPAIVGFNMLEHVRPFEFNPRYKVYRSWDFGRNYPVVTFHQITKENVWYVLFELVGIKADMLDMELADAVIEATNRLCRDSTGKAISKGQIVDRGDFEATHKEDSRRESTVEMLRTKGIDLMVTPTRQGDEMLAIDHLNGRMKMRFTGETNIVIHPRCEYTIRCFNGAWVYETSKIHGFEYRSDSIAVIQPWIDIFDTFKYFIVNVLQPAEIAQVRNDERAKKPRYVTITDKDGAPIGHREVNAWEN